MSDAPPLSAIDANVIVRFIVRDVEHLYDKARAVFEAIDAEQVRVLCDPVILTEVVFALETIYEVPREKIAGSLTDVLRAPGFLIPDKAHYVDALRLYGTTIPHFGDACACAAALEQTDGRLYSFDKKLSSVEGVTRLENPPSA